MDSRMITTDVTEEDYSLEGSLRPQSLEEYIGQEKTKNTLKKKKKTTPPAAPPPPPPPQAVENSGIVKGRSP